jgi:predicted O-methyltransferase YrrM
MHAASSPRRGRVDMMPATDSEPLDLPLLSTAANRKAEQAYSSARLELARALHEADTKLVPNYRYQAGDRRSVKYEAFEGSIKLERARELAAMLQLCAPRRILEIGSFVGLSSNFYLRYTADWPAPPNLTSVDPAIPHRCFEEPRAIWHRMNDRFGGARATAIDAYWTRSWAHEPSDMGVVGHARSVLSGRDLRARGERFDFAFVDGDHRFDSVLRDFWGVVPVMRRFGCIAFDDVDAHNKHHRPSRRAVEQIAREARQNATGVVLWGRTNALFIDRGLFG